MFYQVTANLIFSEEDEAKDFYYDCELALEKTGIINPASANIEYSVIQLINNNHDQEPNQPCEVVDSAVYAPEH